MSAAFLHPLHAFEMTSRNGVAAAIEAEREMLRRPLPHASRPVKAPAGKGATELEFSFWSAMPTARHDKAIWNKRFPTGFPGVPATGPGGIPRRQGLHEEVEAVHEFRGCVAHHEPVFMRDLRAEYACILRVVCWHDRKTAAWLHGAQSVVDLLAQKP